MPAKKSAAKGSMPKGMPPKGMTPGMHKMPGGHMMSDAEMKKMIGKKK